MRTSLILTLLILMGTAFVAMWQKGEAGPLDAEYESLRSEVSQLGVDPHSLAGEHGGLSRMRVSQVLAKVDEIDTKAARDARTRAFAKEISEFAAEMKRLGQKGPPDAEHQAQVMKIMEELVGLQGDDFRVLLQAFRGDSGMSEDTRQEMVGMAVMMLGRQNPQSALNLLSESKDEILKGGRAGFMVGMCLQGLAQKDPAGALAWVESHKDFVDDQAMRQTLQGVAQKNPELAMKRMLDPARSGRDIMPIAASMAAGATEPEARESLLALMRRMTQAAVPASGGTSPAEAVESAQRADLLRKGVLTGIGSRLAEAPFEQSRAWLESSALSPEEKATMVDGIASSMYSKDPSQWLEWMSGNLPEDKLSEKMGQIIPNWTRQDFNAVGAWLNGQPAGKARDEATLSFAETLIPHEPEAAQRWLESLPESPRRAELMNRILAPASATPENGPAVENGPDAITPTPAGDGPQPTPEPGQ